MLRSVNVKDSFALQYAAKIKAFVVGVITVGNSELIKEKFQLLGVDDIYLNSADKLTDFKDFTSKHGLRFEEVMYMGDDIPDYEVMQRVGLPCCPADAAEEIKSVSVYISDKKGGEGCVRDIVEQILRAQNKWVKF